MCIHMSFNSNHKSDSILYKRDPRQPQSDTIVFRQVGGCAYVISRIFMHGDRF